MDAHDLGDTRRELMARVLQHGGVLVAPFGHAGGDSHEAMILDDIAALEAAGFLEVGRDDEGRVHRIELTSSGYRALEVGE
ncbi:hypothetical protein [Halomonas organivorans]|uniref:ArsR family transcriptional regulator n=1 Tax=Halomonas organivorans TaxID=257772 RepID=A0A7W5BZR0_9GAMM|nr:hypothetical protein [Halomonas organivorans]MBB3141193.1 hypothetical protein [Halomonas organivorans]